MEGKSYSKIYLDDVSRNLGTMMEYANMCNIDVTKFWDIFVSSNVARQIERGNPKYLCGMSAIDLFDYVMDDCSNDSFFEQLNYIPITKYYWVGWILAQYQQYKGISFFNINKKIPINKIIVLYSTLHEADVSKFFEIADRYIKEKKEETNLKRIRTNAGMSQSKLAKLADVKLRNIQMYEQRHNDINKAQVDILIRISKVLGCSIEDLLEM